MLYFNKCLVCELVCFLPGAASDVLSSLRSYLNPPPSTDSDSLQNGEYSVTPLGDGGGDLVHTDFVDGLPYVVKSVAGGSDGGGSGEGYCIIEASDEANATDVQREVKDAATEQEAEEEREAVLPSEAPQVVYCAVCIGCNVTTETLLYLVHLIVGYLTN